MRHSDLAALHDTISTARDQMRQWEQLVSNTRTALGVRPEAELLAIGRESLTVGTHAARRLLDECGGTTDRLAAALPKDLIQPLRWEAELAALAEGLSPYKAACQEASARLEAVRDLASGLANQSRAFSQQLPQIDRFVEDTMRQMDWSRLSHSFGHTVDLEGAALGLTAAYRDLYPMRDGLANLAAEALAPVEIFNHTSLLRGLVRTQTPAPRAPEQEEVETAPEEVAQETASTVPALLRRRFPRLHPLWEGAQQAMKSSNPDKARHCVISYRELLRHLIHDLAPAEQAIEWLESEKLDHIEKGRPTQQGRLLYICRNSHQLVPVQRQLSDWNEGS